LPTGNDTLHSPQQTALCAIAGVLESHLRLAASERKRVPLIVQLDGSGHSEMLDVLEAAMARDGAARHAATSAWTVLRFDAWQHQRLAPPWWWLVNALERRIRDDTRPEWRRLVPRALADRRRARCDERGRAGPDELKRALRYVRSRARDWTWHVLQLRHDLYSLAPYVILGGGLWMLVGREMKTVLGSVTTILAGLTVLVAALMKPVRHRLLLSTTRAPTAFLRSSDPMADLRKRYAFLLRTVGTPVLVLVDNLDRCHADYVVDLLEGLQTLLRHPEVDGEQLSFVAFVVAADRDWLCHSFLQKYEDFEPAAREPGRPFGQGFLEKVFDLEARLPTIPVSLTISEHEEETLSDADRKAITDQFQRANTEREVRELVCRAERSAPRPGLHQHPRQVHRIQAVKRLGELEYGMLTRTSVCPVSTQYQCKDTKRVLQGIVDRFDAAAAMIGRIDTAYCVQRTTQLLGGHEIEDDADAIRRLGLWTVLSATWPRLARHLAAHPADIDRLRDRALPSTGDESVREVFADRAARQLAAGVGDAVLTADHVRRYSAPIDTEGQVAGGGCNGSVEVRVG
jgi:hypothetical protein